MGKMGQVNQEQLMESACNRSETEPRDIVERTAKFADRIIRLSFVLSNNPAGLACAPSNPILVRVWPRIKNAAKEG